MILDSQSHSLFNGAGTAIHSSAMLWVKNCSTSLSSSDHSYPSINEINNDLVLTLISTLYDTMYHWYSLTSGVNSYWFRPFSTLTGREDLENESRAMKLCLGKRLRMGPVHIESWRCFFGPFHRAFHKIASWLVCFGPKSMENGVRQLSHRQPPPTPCDLLEWIEDLWRRISRQSRPKIAGC